MSGPVIWGVKAYAFEAVHTEMMSERMTVSLFIYFLTIKEKFILIIT